MMGVKQIAEKLVLKHNQLNSIGRYTPIHERIKPFCACRLTPTADVDRCQRCQNIKRVGNASIRTYFSQDTVQFSRWLLIQKVSNQ